MKSLAQIIFSRVILSYLLIFCLNNILHLNSKSVVLVAYGQAIIPVKIGVVLDMQSIQGKIKWSSINMAISDFYAAHPQFQTRIVLHVRDFKDHDVITATAAVVDLIKNEQVAAIIGPETSLESQFIVNLGDKAQVPIVSYSSTSPLLSSLQNQYFIRAAQDDSAQLPPIRAIIDSFGWREVVPIYVADEFGGGFIPLLADALLEIGTRISYKSAIPLAATDDRIEVELYRLKSMSTRVFLVDMEASLGSRLFLKARQLNMFNGDYVWIITSTMANVLESLDLSVIQAMQGVLGIRTYVPRTKELDNFTVRWGMRFRQENPSLANASINVDGLWAYDAITALTRAVEEVGVTNFTFARAQSLANVSNDIFDVGVSRFGPQLLRAMAGLKFKGLSGNFVLVDRQLQSSIFELINVRDIGGQGIGYWTPSTGLIRDLTSADNSSRDTSKTVLESVIWPGNPPSAPKGWVVSPNGKKLRIGVPLKDGFRQFVTVTKDSATNITEIHGYCIDVFDAVMNKLPYSVLYEYIPFTENGKQPSYDALISQVYLKNFDAVVGDVTIRANRSLYVDFTFPFTESGVIMVVPIESNNKNRAWLFLKPLTWDLWFTTFCSFIFVAFVVWVLEHRINEDFRGPPEHQIGTSLFFSFSTVVFSHSFSVFSNLTRFVIILWVFVVLILIQSYTANLASLLTVEQLQPKVKDVKELIKRGETVGYQQGSFVKHQLISMGFSEAKLKSYNATHHLDELLSKGTEQGGISAAFDEIPYLKVFMAEYCSKYTIVPPMYKTDGFGFVFPKGSLLGLDVSRKVLAVTEGKEMIEIENKWFKKTDCPDSSASFSSKSLSLDSFWGLFTIVAIAAVFSLIASLICFLREHQTIWTDPTASFRTRLKALSRTFVQRNLSSHTFRKSQIQDQSSHGTLSNSPYSQSPSSYWNNSERGINSYEGQSSTP